MSEKMKAYASSFASFLMDRMGGDVDKIKNIILYGSVARGTQTKESDVDIFVDTESEIEEDVKRVLEEFYESRYYTLFKAEGIDNEINLKIGELKEWEELHQSIASMGIVLWGPYKAVEEPIGKKHMVIFYWSKVGRSRTSFLNKLYGFETEGRRREGLLEKWNGKKIGKSSIIIPIRYKDEMMQMIEEYEVHAKNLEVLVPQ